MVTPSALSAEVARRLAVPPIAQTAMTEVTTVVLRVGDHSAKESAIAATPGRGQAYREDLGYLLDKGAAMDCREHAHDRENDPRANLPSRADVCHRVVRTDRRSHVLDIRLGRDILSLHPGLGRNVLGHHRSELRNGPRTLSSRSLKPSGVGDGNRYSRIRDGSEHGHEMSLAHGNRARVNGSHARDDHRADRSCCDAEPELHSRNWRCRARSRRKPVRKRDKQWR